MLLKVQLSENIPSIRSNHRTQISGGHAKLTSSVEARQKNDAATLQV